MIEKKQFIDFNPPSEKMYDDKYPHILTDSELKKRTRKALTREVEVEPVIDKTDGYKEQRHFTPPSLKNNQEIRPYFLEPINLAICDKSEADNFYREAVEKLKIAPAQEIIALLPKSISLIIKSYHANELLIKLFALDEEFVSYFFETIPKQISSDEVFEAMLLLDGISKYDGFAEKMFARFPDVIDVRDVANNHTMRIKSIFNSEKYRELFIDHLPNPFPIDHINMASSRFMDYLASKDYHQSLFNRLPETINVSEITNPILRFLKRMRDFDADIAAERLVFDFSFDDVDEESFFNPFLELLKWILKEGNEHSLKILYDLYKDKFDIFSHEDKIGEVYGWIIRNAHHNKIDSENELNIYEELAEGFPEEINLADLSEGGVSLIISILYQKDVSNKEVLISKINGKIDFYNVKDSTSMMIERIDNEDLDIKIISNLPREITLDSLSSSSLELLKYFSKNRIGEMIPLIKLPVDFSSFPEEQSILLYELAIVNQGEDPLGILTRLQESIKQFPLSYSQNLLIQLLAEAGYFEDELDEILDGLKNTLRHPIKPEKLNLNEKAGEYLYEQIELMPIDFDSKKELSFGWIRYELEKNGSASYVYINQQEYPPKIIFKNDLYAKIDSPHPVTVGENLDAFLDAYDLIPEFINTGVYFELSDLSEEEIIKKSRAQTKPIKGVSKGQSHREVYAGPNLSQIDLTQDNEFTRSIINQRDFILLSLDVSLITHGHPHLGNMNVRFLLKDNDGNKELSFDPNVAIRRAKEENLTLTPIVTLRDWDSATSEGYYDEDEY